TRMGSCSRHRRRFAVPRRCHHHAGDLRSLGGGGPGRGGPAVGPLGRSRHTGHHRRPVLRSAGPYWRGGVPVFAPDTPLASLALGLSGLLHVIEEPGVLAAVNPYHGARFLIHHADVAIPVLGAVFLAVTGAEALYVDLGHFGRRPIVVAWFSIVFPCLLLNYF